MFNELFENLILEGVAAARKRFLDTGKIGQREFDKLVSIDPTPKKKYIEWLVDKYISEDISFGNIEPTIKLFNDLANKNLIDEKDINSYDTWEYFEDTVNSHKNAKSGTEQKKEFKKSAEKIYEDEDILIVVPKTEESSVYYGKGTKWCTAALRDNMYNDYTYDNKIKLYYILPKNDDYEKLALAVYPNGRTEYYNVLDETPSNAQIPDTVRSLDTEGFFTAFTDAEIAKLDKDHVNIIIKKLTDLGEQDENGYWNFIGKVSLFGKNLNEIPIKFGRVDGDFDIRGNNITSLKNSPYYVGGGFYCSDNNITSLEGGPKIVVQEYYCNSCKLESLKGSPDECSVFDCTNNKITSLDYLPRKVSFFYCNRNNITSLKGCPDNLVTFACDENVSLTSLEGGPTIVKNNYTCSQTSITSLKGSPEIIGGTFGCESCELTSLEGGPKKADNFYCNTNKLKSLIGGPKEVGENYFCYNNQLESLEGSPEIVAGLFECSNNNITSLEGGPKIAAKYTFSHNKVTSFKGIQKAGVLNWDDNPITDFSYKPDVARYYPPFPQDGEEVRKY